MLNFLLALLAEVQSTGQKQLDADFKREAIPHMDSLYNFALKMTGDTSDASDLLQDTYLKAFRFFDKLDEGTNYKMWLFRIMKNSYINIFGKNNKELDKAEFLEIERFYDNIKASNVDRAHLEKDIYDNFVDDELSKAITSLPENLREVVILANIEGFVYDEIADLIDVPVGTIRSRIYRGRKMMFTKLYNLAKNRGYLKNEK